MPKAQRTFTHEFKLEAVRLAQSTGKSLTQVARDLGIADSTLSHWCKRFRQHGNEAFPEKGASNATGGRTPPAQTGIR
jgi:transposase